MRLSAYSVDGIPEVSAGDDLATIVGDALLASGGVDDGDIVTITSKVVSKAEGRQVAADSRDDAITSQTVRVVAQRGQTRIVENPLGLVMAAAGVDASNAPDGVVLLLPEDPDASARSLRAALQERFGVRLGVLITDTSGRAWRQGQTDIAIGAAGIRVLDDLRGTTDVGGKPLAVTLPAVADELAGLAELVTGKTSQHPVAVVRGLSHLLTDDPVTARDLVRPADQDMFRLGSDEAWREGYAAGVRAQAPQ